MKLRNRVVKELKKLHFSIKPQITSRLSEFKAAWESNSGKKIFDELVFCLLTPQSNAKSCWAAVEGLKNKRILFTGNTKQLAANLNRARFKNNKARYIAEARDRFVPLGKHLIKPSLKRLKNVFAMRDWLVSNVKGYGYKEASHFLRNIGLGRDIAILDRHILKNLKQAGVIRTIPKTISKAKYIEIEDKMRAFSRKIKIPLDHLDLLLWYKEAGEVFK